MACFNPIEAYELCGQYTDNGKKVIVWRVDSKVPYKSILVRCGKCVGCLNDRVNDWAVRCVHEASLHPENCFITLTYNNEWLPPGGGLRRSDFVLFMKRLRKRFVTPPRDLGIRDPPEVRRALRKGWIGAHRIRFFHCGEYGSDYSRPHHHACLFNFMPDDLELYKVKRGVRLFTSESLEEVWSSQIRKEDFRCYDESTIFEREGKIYAKHGFCTVGDVSIESAAYIARYAIKQHLRGSDGRPPLASCCDEDGVVDELSEYVTMSRNPGIGGDWIKKYWSDCYPKDHLHLNGFKWRNPRYYDEIYDRIDPEDMAKVKAKRMRMAMESDNRDLKALRARQKAAIAKLKLYERSFEYGSEDV